MTQRHFFSLKTYYSDMTPMIIFAQFIALYMVSRRNIRVKVMQTLYAGLQEDAVTPDKAAMVKTLTRHLDESIEISVALIHVITEVARYAEKDARLRASKHLPTESDLNVNTKLAGNTLLWHILEHPTYKQINAQLKPSLKIPDESIRKLYIELVSSATYKTYINTEGREKKQEKEILVYIFKDLILPNEGFTDLIEELFIHWQDDAEMIEALILNFLNKPDTYNFLQFISLEKRQYAQDLLIAVIDKKEICEKLIHDKLQNWDPERIALLDMIMMRMGICEFLYFETIPPKVTINEYIDLAKDYSTPQSGHFVNGILDSIHKELTLENKLHKVSHKK
jgi:N utilization substance protein B